METSSIGIFLVGFAKQTYPWLWELLLCYTLDVLYFSEKEKGFQLNYEHYLYCVGM